MQISAEQTPADSTLIPTLEALWNEVAGNYNQGISDEAGRLIWVAIDVAQHHPLPADHDLIDLLCLFRLIAWQVKDQNAVLKLDELIDPFLGTGLTQYQKKDDVALRAAANSVLAACHDDAPNSLELLRNFLTTFTDEKYLFLSAVDVFKAIQSVCLRANETDLIKICDHVLLTLHAQEQKTDILRKCMSKIRPDAIDYPAAVSIETYSKCNAKCNFCPYPEMDKNGDRVGTRMSRKLFHKIIADLGDIPSDHSFTINLSRVNEPLLDKRIFEFIAYIGEHLPQCVVGFPSNGSTLSKRNIQKLAGLPNFTSLSVSINATNAESYKAIMGLDFDRTVKNLDTLHAMCESGEVGFHVWLTAVLGGDQKVDVEWCRERYPGFNLSIYEATNWFGLTDNTTGDPRVAVGSCKDWYQIHILADGNEALCCYDALGRHGEGNAKDIHLLDLFNLPWRREVRRKLAIRQSSVTPEFCKKCDYA